MSYVSEYKSNTSCSRTRQTTTPTPRWWWFKKDKAQVEDKTLKKVSQQVSQQAP
jgi:hypothetical protein